MKKKNERKDEREGREKVAGDKCFASGWVEFAGANQRTRPELYGRQMQVFALRAREVAFQFWPIPFVVGRGATCRLMTACLLAFCGVLNCKPHTSQSDSCLVVKRELVIVSFTEIGS